MKQKAKPAEVNALQSHIGFWLRFVSNHVSHAFALKLADSGVTVAEWVILREMYSRSDIAPSDIAEITGLTRGAVSKLVDRLVAKRLVSRHNRSDDRRYQTIALTAAGAKVVPSLATLADVNDEEFFSALTPRERDTLVSTLKKLVEINGLKRIATE